jgi:hypothetical protein
MTAINYPDLTVISPAGRVRLEIRSPDNDPVNPRPIEEWGERRIWGGFQSDFVFTGVATDSGKVIWRRTQSRHESSPRGAWVDDDARAVVQTVDTFFSQLLLLDPQGRATRIVQVGDHLGERELHWTSAGPMWERGGHGYMLLLGGRPHWCFRLVNSRRLLIDLERADFLDAAAHAELLDHAERQWAFATLQRNVLRLDAWERDENPWDHSADAIDDVLVALHLAGALAVRSAVPLVQRVERSPLEGGYTTGRLPESATPESPDGAIEIAFLPFRQLAARTLRRLGVEPAGYACCLIRPSRDWRPGEPDDALAPIPFPQCIPDRAARAAALTPGMSRWDVLHRLGVPDHGYWRNDWDYDFGVAGGGGDEAFTVRLTWTDDAGRLANVERVRPACWIEDDDRRSDWC